VPDARHVPAVSDDATPHGRGIKIGWFLSP
jgi:hypothetical protein